MLRPKRPSPTWSAVTHLLGGDDRMKQRRVHGAEHGDALGRGEQAGRPGDGLERSRRAGRCRRRSPSSARSAAGSRCRRRRAMRASARQSGQLADQRSGTLVAERPDEQLTPNRPSFSALALCIARRSRMRWGGAVEQGELRNSFAGASSPRIFHCHPRSAQARVRDATLRRLSGFRLHAAARSSDEGGGIVRASAAFGRRTPPPSRGGCGRRGRSGRSRRPTISAARPRRCRA